MKAELPDIGEDAIRSTVTTPDSASIAESSTTAESNPKDSSDGDQSISVSIVVSVDKGKSMKNK